MVTIKLLYNQNNTTMIARNENLVLSVLLTIIVLIHIIFLFASCNDDDGDPLKSPSVTQPNVVNKTATNAQVNAEVTDEGSSEVTERGFYISEINDLSAATQILSGSGPGEFSVMLENLTPATNYWVWAYAANSDSDSISAVSFFQTIERTVTDVDNNAYEIKEIGDQVWMLSNLKTTKFDDGTSIPRVADDMQWANVSTPAYTYPLGDEGNKSAYGLLYNSYAVHSEKKLCPAGFHIPTRDEWRELIDYLGGAEVAGGKLKEQGTLHWDDPNIGATDEVGFAARGAGGRTPSGSYMEWFNYYAAFYSSTESYAYLIVHDVANISENSAPITNGGYSVRCIQD